ncbi:hypothetical protein ZWY2020_022100 [Hordeum vulgare]|nr:hypothetical protein ZWY2020_022100 [Hordeum vulgare]
MGLLSRSEELAVLVRLKVAAGPIKREIPPEMHWAFAYEMLQRVSCSLALGPELRNAVCVFYLVQGLVLIPPSNLLRRRRRRGCDDGGMERRRSSGSEAATELQSGGFGATSSSLTVAYPAMPRPRRPHD